MAELQKKGEFDRLSLLSGKVANGSLHQPRTLRFGKHVAKRECS
jgi:hypothetical protein